MKRKGIHKPTIEDAVEISGIETLHPGGFDLTRRTAEIAGLKYGMKVLDVSSGSGTQAIYYAENYSVQVTGINISEKMIKTSIENVEISDIGKNVVLNESKVNIVIVTGSCCIPGMAALDEEAIKTVERAVAEIGVQTNIKLLPVTKAMFGGVPKDLYNKMMGEHKSSGRIGLPAIIINGKLASYGAPDYENVINVLSNII